jgi:hypothetical protein
VAVSDVASILPATSIQQASSSGSTPYLLRLQTNTGKNYTLIDDIESRQEARWIVFEIEKRAGLRLNTQVRMDDGCTSPGIARSANKGIYDAIIPLKLWGLVRKRFQ